MPYRLPASSKQKADAGFGEPIDMQSRKTRVAKRMNPPTTIIYRGGRCEWGSCKLWTTWGVMVLFRVYVVFQNGARFEC